MLTAKTKYGHIINLEKYADDGRLTEPRDEKMYRMRDAIEKVKQLGRPLTLREMKDFEIR